MRADADSRIGVGHVMRCLALAHAWQHFGGRVLLVARSLPNWIAARLGADDIDHIVTEARAGSADDAAHVIGVANEMGASWLVVDGYDFTEPYLRHVAEGTARLAVIDDLVESEHYPADLVLNQNLHATEKAYAGRVATKTVLLLGPRYSLIRREFWPWAERRKRHPAVARRLLVTLGGGEHGDLLERVVDAVTDFVPEIRDITTSAASPRAADSRADALASSTGNSDDVAQLMARADIAVSGAGSTVWELALMRVPSVLVKLSDNQSPVASSLVSIGATASSWTTENFTAEQLGRAVGSLARDAVRRRSLAATGRALVDGEGGRRVVQHMLGELIHAERLGRPGG